MAISMAAASLLQLASVVDCFHDTNPLLFGRSDLRVGLSSMTPKMMICSDNDRNKQFNNNEDGKNNKDDNDLISNGAVLPHPVTNIYSPRPRKKIPDRRRVLRDTSWLCAWMSCFSGHLQNAKAATTTTLSVPIAASWPATSGILTGDTSNSKQRIRFDPSAYAAMRDDQTRTPMFEKSIR